VSSSSTSNTKKSEKNPDVKKNKSEFNFTEEIPQTQTDVPPQPKEIPQTDVPPQPKEIPQTDVPPQPKEIPQTDVPPQPKEIDNKVPTLLDSGVASLNVKNSNDCLCGICSKI